MTIDETRTAAAAPGDETAEPTWHKSACILCECNCGIEIRLGSDGHTFDRIRGDKEHPASKGYTCEKALRLDHYQNGRGERVVNPLRRRGDGTFHGVLLAGATLTPIDPTYGPVEIAHPTRRCRRGPSHREPSRRLERHGRGGRSTRRSDRRRSIRAIVRVTDRPATPRTRPLCSCAALG